MLLFTLLSLFFSLISGYTKDDYESWFDGLRRYIIALKVATPYSFDNVQKIERTVNNYTEYQIVQSFVIAVSSSL